MSQSSRFKRQINYLLAYPRKFFSVLALHLRKLRVIILINNIYRSLFGEKYILENWKNDSCEIEDFIYEPRISVLRGARRGWSSLETQAAGGGGGGEVTCAFSYFLPSVSTMNEVLNHMRSYYILYLYHNVVPIYLALFYRCGTVSSAWEHHQVYEYQW